MSAFPVDLPRTALLAALLLLQGCDPIVPTRITDMAVLREQVAAVERAFAQTMADRNAAAFADFIADDAVFLNGGDPLRGKQLIVQRWQKFFGAGAAPFSWRPELVEVLGSGTLAESTGPVFDADGKLIAHYYSTWRRDAPGVWHIVFDNGYDVCACAAQER